MLSSLAGTAAGKVLAVAPPACFLFLQTSGLSTVRSIKAAKSVGAFSPLPFLSLLTNCAVWSVYGALVGDFTVLAPNLSGLAFGAYYTYTFDKYNDGPSLAKYGAASAAIVAGVTGAALALPAETAATAIGMTGCVLAVGMMSAPLAVMGTVLRERSTASLPFATSLATFANATSWTAYGYLVAGDPFIIAPNALGFVAACVQLSLFVRFGISPPAAEAASDKKKLVDVTEEKTRDQ